MRTSRGRVGCNLSQVQLLKQQQQKFQETARVSLDEWYLAAPRSLLSVFSQFMLLSIRNDRSIVSSSGSVWVWNGPFNGGVSFAPICWIVSRSEPAISRSVGFHLESAFSGHTWADDTVASGRLVLSWCVTGNELRKLVKSYFFTQASPSFYLILFWKLVCSTKRTWRIW